MHVIQVYKVNLFKVILIKNKAMLESFSYILIYGVLMIVNDILLTYHIDISHIRTRRGRWWRYRQYGYQDSNRSSLRPLHERVSAYISAELLDIFKETSGQLRGVFVATKNGYFSQEVRNSCVCGNQSRYF